MTGVAILGPGGVGGFLAGALERAVTPVTIVAREPTAEAIAREGIHVASVRLGAEFDARPHAVAELDATGMTLIVATKAAGLAAALERVHGEPELVVPMLNGLDHVEQLRERFGRAAVPAASIRIESTRVAPGSYEQTSGFLRIDVAPPSDAVAGFAAMLEGAGVPVRVLDSEAQAMWGKLVRLNALACTTSAYDLPLGAIRERHRGELRACVEEAAAVARAEGARIDPGATMAELDDAHAELRTSMQRDIAAGRPPELDAIPGAVLRAAARHGLDCPAIERLAELAADRAGMPAPT